MGIVLCCGRGWGGGGIILPGYATDLTLQESVAWVLGIVHDIMVMYHGCTVGA